MKKKVMIVDDDDRIFLEELNQTLILNGYDVVVVNDPVSAVDMVFKTEPDVILLNIKMPTRNGLRIANELKNYLGYDNIPIIALTGITRDADVKLMNVCGIQNCIRKPFHTLDVISNIEKVL
jgi:CheY-like chemotaxis protein